jgi:hypothetical protein
MAPALRLLPALLAVLIGAGCQSKAEKAAPPSAEKMAADARPEKDRIYQRTKDCAEQAERATLKARWSRALPSPYAFQSFEYHYSPKYDRCFVESYFFATGPERNTVPT